MKLDGESQIELKQFTGQFHKPSIHQTFNAMRAELAVRRFLKSGLLQPEAQHGLRFVIENRLRLDVAGDHHERRVAELLKQCSQFKFHRPQKATIRRVTAARELLAAWQLRKVVESRSAND